jgi:hypothetical protein
VACAIVVFKEARATAILAPLDVSALTFACYRHTATYAVDSGWMFADISKTLP